MAWAKATRITSWSYSRWSDYNECPKKAYYKHVEKIKEPANDAMERGTSIHELAENYLKGAIRNIPAELKKFADGFKMLRKAKASPEASWTFRNDWSVTEWNDWNGAWARIKADAFYQESDPAKGVIIDFKTGRLKTEGYQLQLELYAVSAFTIFPALEEVRTQLWYLDHPQQGTINPTDEPYTRDQFDRLRKGWEKRVTPMLRDVTFKATPGRSCTYCYFRKNNTKYPGGAGPCKY